MLIHKTSKNCKHEFIFMFTCRQPEFYLSLMLFDYGFEFDFDFNLKGISISAYTFADWAACKYGTVPKMWTLQTFSKEL